MFVSSEDRPLFSEGDIQPTLLQQERKLREEVEQYDGERFLGSSPEDLITYFADRARVEPIELHEDSITTDQKETTLDTSRIPNGRFLFGLHQPTVPATAFSFFVPYTGDQALFRLRPMIFGSMAPHGKVHGSDLVLTFVSTDKNPETIRAAYDKQIQQIKQHLANLRSSVDAYNAATEKLARECVNQRRDRLLKDRAAVASLGFPVRARPGTSETFSAPAIRRKILPPPVATKPTTNPPDPVVDMGTYEEILSLLQNMALVLERNPGAFKKMEEEDLRHHFLVQLNGRYEGEATGETFNAAGKTDILVRHQGKNIFIAECKFWHGPREFTAAIDQLLQYLSWRDTKSALLVFNRGTAMSTVIAKIPGLIESHPNYRKSIPQQEETHFRAILTQKNDPDREIVLTAMVFSVPS